MLRRIIYVSRSLVGSDVKKLDAIVQSSVRRNAEAEVTGMMWVCDGQFAQVLEGSCQRLGQTMDRILSDCKHTDIQVMLNRSVSSRQFGDWSMRRARVDDASDRGSTFMIGFAMGERTPVAKQLYDIVVASVI